MKIGILAPRLSLCDGVGLLTLRTLEALQEFGFSLQILAAEDCPSFPKLNVFHRILPPATPRCNLFHAKLKSVRCLVKNLLKECDYIHAFSESYAPLAMWVSNGRPYYVTIYGSYAYAHEDSFVRTCIQRYALCRSKQLLPISSITNEVLRKVVPSAKTTVIRPALPKPEYLSEMRSDKLTQKVLCVGALKRRKGQIILARAMGLVVREFPHAKCNMVGTGEYAPDYELQLRSEIEKLNLKSTVYLCGHLNEIELICEYKTAEIFVLPAICDEWRFEGYGFVLTEAAAFGLPIISSSGSVAEEILINYKSGILVNVSDGEGAKRLSEKICFCLRDRNYACEMGRQARQSVAIRNWQHVVAELAEVYKSL